VKKFFLLSILFSCLFIFSGAAGAADKNLTLTEDTTAAVYLNAGQIFKFYQSHINELAKPENADNLTGIQKRLQGFTKAEVNLSELFKSCADFIQKELIVPNGPAWIAVDEFLRPQIIVNARIKPLELLEFIESNIDQISTEAIRREQNLVEFRIPVQNHDLLLSVTPDGISLKPENMTAREHAVSKWSDFNSTVSSEKTLIAGEIDLDRLKRLIIGRTSNQSHATCYSNLRLLATALEMYSMDKETAIEKLDQKELIAERYLNSELFCPDSGSYTLNAAREAECNVHGTIRKPASSNVSSATAGKEIPSQFKPMKTLKFHALKDYAELSLAIEDSLMVEQWAAIGKQQLLTIKNMAQNQMGQLPESERQKGMQMLDSIKINHEGQWLKLSVENLDENAVISGLTGLAGAIVIPNFKKARQQARASACRANRRVLVAASEMYELDTGKPLSQLDMELLVKSGYIKKAVKCPEGGNYNLVRENNDTRVECSRHQGK